MAQHGDLSTINVSSIKTVDLLHSRAVGLIGVLFLTVTGAAPMSAMLGNVPFAAGYGIGIHTPAAFALATIVLTIFSIGYAAMAAKVSTVGGFYSFISQGLGREVGMSAGISSLACYSVFEASLTGLFAYFGNSWIAAHLGINVPWIVLAIFMIALTAVLSYRDVKLSVAVLGVALVLEVLMLAIFGFGVATAKTGTSFSLEALNVFSVTVPVAEQKVGDVAIPAGAAAVGIFMAFWSWVGFEMAPNYAEESRDAKRIVPRSLYLSVIGLGVFYTLVSWAAVSAYATEGDMLAKAVGDSGNFFLAPIEQFVGGWAMQLMSVLILTSSFACGMAFHNTASRYMYSLGREGVIPAAMGATHKTFRSPHVASLVQSVLAAVWVVLYGVFNGWSDPNAQAYLGIYTLFAILGTGLLLVLQAIVSVAIWNYFRKAGGGNVISTVVAPFVSLVAQIWLVYLLVANLATFGGTSAFANSIPYVGLAIIVVGLIWGFALKSMNPEAYRNIGHMVNEG
ncbi:MAG: APC family permease [Rhizobiales bacterium]|nr:APC family permease [Hyphomicrobiales bacterium]MBI3674881.1 APC family permease [Hyphomicrobiales bacterium]